MREAVGRSAAKPGRSGSKGLLLTAGFPRLLLTLPRRIDMLLKRVTEVVRRDLLTELLDLLCARLDVRTHDDGEDPATEAIPCQFKDRHTLDTGPVGRSRYLWNRLA